MGADALRAATGRDHEGWRTVLAEAGALDWSHAETARWLVDTQGVSGWWAQGITVDFEQARKGRLPGQKSDGTFATSVTRTIPGERLEALAAVKESVQAVHERPQRHKPRRLDARRAVEARGWRSPLRRRRGREQQRHPGHPHP